MQVPAPVELQVSPVLHRCGGSQQDWPEAPQGPQNPTTVAPPQSSPALQRGLTEQHDPPEAPHVMQIPPV
jgi:hypothetical protein